MKWGLEFITGEQLKLHLQGNLSTIYSDILLSVFQIGVNAGFSFFIETLSTMHDVYSKVNLVV